MSAAIARGMPSEIPPDARRHDLGWPLALAALAWAVPAHVAALGLIWGALAGSIVLSGLLARRFAGATDRDAARVATGVAILYPTALYYHSFALGESLFVFLLLAGTWLFLSGRQTRGYLVAGLAAMIRTPGLALPLAFAVAELTTEPRPCLRGCIARLAAALAPAALVHIGAHTLIGVTPTQYHQPRFGLPFSGFRGLGALGAARVTYVLAAVGSFCAGTAWIVYIAARMRPLQRFAAVSALFCAVFLVFHLCLQSLLYQGHRVFTFNYFDRYLLALLPFVLIAARRLLVPWVLAAGLTASLVLSAYWGHNYFRTVAAQPVAAKPAPRPGV